MGHVNVAKQFISEFHNLPGDTPQHTHQNLYILLQQYSRLKNEPETVSLITKNLEPTNHLEKILRIDFLIYFKLYDNLYEDFIRGDEIAVKKLSKQEWFFQRAFNEVNYEDFTNNILPAISYSLKLKILKKLPVEEKDADQFFNAVCIRYGIFLATVLLPKCSNTTIKDALQRYPVKLTVSQLKVIFEKDPDLIYVYVEERIKIEGKSTFMDANPIFKYIAQKNPEMFNDLFYKYSFQTKLGRRTTKGLINSQKSAVIDNHENYLKILNNGVMVRKVGSEIREVFFKNCPNQRELYWKSLIKHYPKYQQFDIFKSTYDCVYRRKFGEDVNAITEDMLNMIPNAEEREKIALQKMEQEGKNDYLKYVTSNYCLKELMDKINHLTTSERTKYVEFATECCCLNKDVSGLLKMCELVCVRFKNDDATIRRGFLSTLCKAKFVFDVLNEKHWKYITEIVATEKAKNSWCPSEETLILEYIKYLIKNDKCIKNAVQKSCSWDYMILYSDIRNDSKTLKILLSGLIEVGLVKPDNDDPCAAARFDCELAYYCKIYNYRNPIDTIVIFNHPRIIKSVKQILEDDTNTYIGREGRAGIQYIVCQRTSSEEIHQLKKLYFKSLKSIGQIGGLMWFLKHEPKTLQENFDQFLNVFVETRGLNPTRFWKLIKKCPYLDLGRRTVDFCKQKLAEEGFTEKKNLVRPLTILSSPSSHVQFIKPYLPTSDKVDLTDDDIKDLYTLQGKVVGLLHYLNSPEEVLNATFDFCKGDYLQFALSPLYSSIYKLPENETKQFINKLDEIKALSVRKHAMNLSCVIYDADAVYNCLKNANVPSLIPAIKYFSKNPSDALWKVIETQINALNKNELQMLKIALTEIDIPFEYQSKYIETVWNILDKHDNNELKKLLFSKINKTCIPNLNSELAFQIIRNSIFKIEEAHDVVANILIYLNDNQKFTILTDILTDFKRNCWNHPEMRKPSRRKLNVFMVNLFGKYMEAKESNTKFVAELETLFSSIFTLSEAFEESVVIKCLNFKHENAESCSKLLIQLNNVYNKEYGTFAVHLFADTLNNCIFKHVFKTNSEKIELCHSLLGLKESISDYLLVIKLLPNNEPVDQKSFTLYNSIMIQLRQVNNNLVQLQFNLFLKSGPYKNTKLDWDKPRLCSNIS